ncbi:MAG TPA: hypothetical protein GX403_12330 [Rhodocyclaceae bacterium]|nr:hypothetical protein [Rhodocyclaceae bacterium]
MTSRSGLERGTLVELHCRIDEAQQPPALGKHDAHVQASSAALDTL